MGGSPFTFPAQLPLPLHPVLGDFKAFQQKLEISEKKKRDANSSVFPCDRYIKYFHSGVLIWKIDQLLGRKVNVPLN